MIRQGAWGPLRENENQVKTNNAENENMTEKRIQNQTLLPASSVRRICPGATRCIAALDHPGAHDGCQENCIFYIFWTNKHYMNIWVGTLEGRNDVYLGALAFDFTSTHCDIVTLFLLFYFPLRPQAPWRTESQMMK